MIIGLLGKKILKKSALLSVFSIATVSLLYLANVENANSSEYIEYEESYKRAFLQDKFKINSLMNAAIEDNAVATSILIRSGNNINYRNSGGATALHIAARSGSSNVVKVLLENSADYKVRDNERFTPLMRASLAGDSRGVKLLRDVADDKLAWCTNRYKQTALFLTAMSNCQSCAEILLENAGKNPKYIPLIKSEIKKSIIVVDKKGNEEFKLMLENYLKMLEDKKYSYEFEGDKKKKKLIKKKEIPTPSIKKRFMKYNFSGDSVRFECYREDIPKNLTYADLSKFEKKGVELSKESSVAEGSDTQKRKTSEDNLKSESKEKIDIKKEEVKSEKPKRKMVFGGGSTSEKEIGDIKAIQDEMEKARLKKEYEEKKTKELKEFEEEIRKREEKKAIERVKELEKIKEHNKEDLGASTKISKKNEPTKPETKALNDKKKYVFSSKKSRSIEKPRVLNVNNQESSAVKTIPSNTEATKSVYRLQKTKKAEQVEKKEKIESPKVVVPAKKKFSFAGEVKDNEFQDSFDIKVKDIKREFY